MRGLESMKAPALTISSVVVQSREPVAVEVERSVVMMSIAREKYYGLEGAGSRIWKLLETPRQVSELCAALQREFDVDDAECRRDVLEFLTSMVIEGLVEVRSEAPGPVSPPAIP
jgi:hypothetical protein